MWSRRIILGVMNRIDGRQKKKKLPEGKQISEEVFAIAYERENEASDDSERSG